jgi:nitrous oxidase accessory protein NosD
MKALGMCLFAVMLGVAAVPKAARGQGAVILVDDDRVQCPTAQFTSIQPAIDSAAAGSVIRVCPGTYKEQLSINKTLRIEGENGAILMPTNMIANGTESTGPLAAAILVEGAANVEIEGLIIDGTNNGIVGCGPDLYGVLFQNSSGSVRHNAVRHFRLGSADAACQSGEAIEIDNPGGANLNVRVGSNSVWDYQKNGITVNDTGTTAEIVRNVVTGIGPTGGAAQNGVQVGFGATGSIRLNNISGNVWSPCVSPTDCSTNATGILVFDSNSVEIHENVLTGNQIGAFIGGDDSRIELNEVADSPVLIGVAVVGNDDRVLRNIVSHADQAGVYIQGDGNRVRENEITDAGIGVLKISGSTGTVINGNLFFATPITVQDPAPTKQMGVSPKR